MLLKNIYFIPYKELIADMKNKLPKKRKYVTGESDDDKILKNLNDKSGHKKVKITFQKKINIKNDI